MKLSDIVSVRREQAAIVLEDGLKNKALAGTFTPTQASVMILKKVLRAVAPDASFNERAFNWYGTYGAGKSRLAVLIGQALGNGVGGPEFETFLNRLTDIGEATLAKSLKNTFLPPDDEDARPYFIVPLSGVRSTSIQAALVEALYGSLVSAGFDPAELMPKTAYDVALDRIAGMLEQSPSFADEYLPNRNIGDDYLALSDLQQGLRSREAAALSFFTRWHKAVTFGIDFVPENFGAKSFQAIYASAAAALQKRQYRGIAVIWDEFGNAIEDMLTNSARNAQAEISELQSFVEHVCTPSQGHILFFGLTHVSLAEYGPRQGAAEGIRDNLTKIEGRFSILKIEMKAAESEGYHLLAGQISKSGAGRNALDLADDNAQKVIAACQQLNLFSHLGAEVDFVVKQCYPLHPVTTAALLALSNRYAAATRTAFHFLPDLEDNGRLNTDISQEALYRHELVRIPDLVEYYGERMRRTGLEEQLDAHYKNLSQLGSDGADARDIAERRNVMSTVFLSGVLDGDFQPKDEFLAVALHDSGFDSPECAGLRSALAWLNNAGLIWKNPTTQLWKTGGDGAVDVDKLIDESTENIPKQPLAKYLRDFPSLANDVLPMLGLHTLDPSPAGIVRRYAIEAKAVAEVAHINLTNLAAKAVIVLTSGLEEAQQFEQSLLGKQRANIFYWISFTEPRNVDQLARRYLGMSALLSQSHNDATKTRLNAKFEDIRNELKASFGRLYGREGLREKTTKVIQQGEVTPIEVSSWHGFASCVQHTVDATYVNEVAVRAPQREYNVLGGDGSPDAKINMEIVDAILRFKAGAADDLLGEAESSQPAAIIDGVLGANNMFVRRAAGWDFKTIEELSDNVKYVVEEVRKHLFRRRDRSYSLYELRRLFEAAPYGIPVCALPILIAYAVREDLGRLTWTQSGSAAKNICEGMVNERIGVRFADFTGHQLNVLEVVRHALDEINEEKFGWLAAEQEAARQAVEQLRDWVKTIAEPILKSPKLDKRFREIADAFKGVAVSTHEVVDRLVAAVDPQRDLGAGNAPYEAKKKARETLVEILTAYRQVEDERRFEFLSQLRAAVNTLDEDPERNAILAEIATMDSEGVRVAELLRYFPLSDRACTALIERLSGASFAEVSDTSAGIAIGRLGTMIDTARRLIARAASVQATQHPSTQTTLVDDDREEGDSAAFTTLANATPFWPHVQRTQPHVAQASTSTSTSTSTSATMPASFWPGVVRREESTQTTQTAQTTQSAQSNEDAADWRVALKDVLSGWSEREDIDKDEMVALLQAFIAELEAKV
jgi:hypothetical protein